MEKLFEIFVNLIKNNKYTFKRYLLNNIDWNNRLIAIKGARGVGKTIMLLQHIKETFKIHEEILYASLDNIYFTTNPLIDLADIFYKMGGKFLFLDEIHKYPNWSIEIKNIYDNYPDLKIVFTGSSILDINKGFADLSRRAVSYDLHGLSFREYLELEKGVKISTYSQDDIHRNQIEISQDISSRIKPLVEFDKYIEYGYYPYFKENKNNYHERLRNTINTVLESDLPSIEKIEYGSILKIKKLLNVISTAVPFKPNISKLSERLEISRNLLLELIEFLRRAKIINLLTDNSKGISILSKPQKIYLNNTNLIYALGQQNINMGSIRETFFLNQLKANHKVNYTKETDFIVDDIYYYEIGGKNKTNFQIKNLSNSFIAADDIEIGFRNKIPLWLFGFLY